jgi:O-antigen/teichoic acid export membrane protein
MEASVVMPPDPLVKKTLPPTDPPIVAWAEVSPSEVSPGADLTGFFSVQGMLDRARSMKGLLRLKPFDTSTEEGRSRERYRRAALTTITSVMARCVTVFTSLLTVRLTIRYLGTERYGLWMTVTSVVSMLTFADLGIGNGLLNAIAEARGRDDVESVHKYASSAFFVLLGIATLLLGIFACAYPFIHWPRIFNVSSPIAIHESGPAVIVFLVCFLTNIPLDVVQRVQTGHQEGYLANFWMIVGNLTGLGCLIMVMHRNGGLPWLILAILGGQILGVLGNWGQEFGFARPELLPKWAYWDTAAARKILNTGFMFFLIQICGAFTLPLDLIIITQILGPEAVTQYSVPIRLFLLVVTVANMFVLPLWPAYGEAFARGDMKWVKSTLFHSLGYSVLVFGPVALGLAVFGKLIVRVWVGPQIHPTLVLLVGMAFLAMIMIVSGVMNIFLNGINKLKFQATVGLLQAVVGLGLKIVMTKKFGLAGVIWASVATTFLGTGVFFLYVRRLFAQMDEQTVREPCL